MADGTVGSAMPVEPGAPGFAGGRDVRWWSMRHPGMAPIPAMTFRERAGQADRRCVGKWRATVAAVVLGWGGHFFGLGVWPAHADEPAAGSIPPDGIAVEARQLLKVHCVSCHNPDKRKGGLDMSTREGLFTGGENGPALMDGRPEESALVSVLAAGADPHMPPKKQLTEAQIGVLTEWVRNGAPWHPAAGEAEINSLRPVALGPLPPEYHPVLAMAISSDGRRLAAGCGPDLMVFELDAEKVTLRARGRAHFDPVQSIAWTSDGSRLVTGAFRRVVVWQAATLSPEREIMSGLTDRITALEVRPDGRRVLLADGLVGEHGVIRVMDLTSGLIERSWAAHADTIFGLASSPDGMTVATAGGDALVKIWDVAGGTEVARLEAHGTQVLGLAFNADGSQLVTAGADRHLKVWDVKTRENIIALASKPSAINGVTWGPAGAITAVTDDGSAFRYTDLKAHTGAQSSETGQERRLGQANSALVCVVATPDGSRVFGGTSDGRLFSWNAEGQMRDPVELTSVTVAATTSDSAASSE